MPRTRIVFQQRNRPITTPEQRREAIAGMAEEHPVLCALRDVLDEQLIQATGSAAEMAATAYDTGYLAATLDLRGVLEQLRQPKS